MTEASSQIVCLFASLEAYKEAAVEVSFMTNEHSFGFKYSESILLLPICTILFFKK